MTKRQQVSDIKIDLDQAAILCRKSAYSVNEFLTIHPIGRTGFYEEVAAGRLVVRKQGNRTIVLDTDYQNYLEALPKLDPADLPSKGEASE